MARLWPDNPHSRLVFWLKILLPLTALVLLSTLFLLSRTIRPEDAIPYAEVDVADRIRTPRLTAPDFAGMTEDGAALSLKAAEVTLGTEGNAAPDAISKLAGLIETPDGSRTDITALEARLDPEARHMILGGGVILTNSTGYRVETEGLRVALDRTSLDSLGPVTATGPAGTFTAGSLHLGLATATTYEMVFKDGVQMVYLPGTQGPAP